MVDNFKKWHAILKRKRSTSAITIKFLRELVARFEVIDSVISDNVTHLTSSEFKNFNKNYAVKHVARPIDQARSIGQAAPFFFDTLKKSLRLVNRMKRHYNYISNDVKCKCHHRNFTCRAHACY